MSISVYALEDAPEAGVLEYLDVPQNLVSVGSIQRECSGSHIDDVLNKSIFKAVNYASECQQGSQVDIKESLETSLTIGLSCLAELKTDMAYEHFEKISNSLRQKDKLEVYCPDNDRVFSRALVGAYVRVYRGREFSLNMRINKMFTGSKLKSNIFHEFFHVIGYGHEEGVDYAYACSECCFDNNKLACQLCSTRLDDDSVKVAKLMEKFSRTNDKAKSGLQHLLTINKKEFPSLKAISPLMELIKRFHPSVFIELEKIILTKHKNISQKELRSFSVLKPKLYEYEIKSHEKTKDEAKRLAELFYAYLSGEKTKDELELQADEFKSMLVHRESIRFANDFLK